MYRSFTEELFQQPIDQVTQVDLETYFQQEREETLFLEFKSFTDKEVDKRPKTVKDAERIKGVLKTIDAFLNSSGGLLIWGAPEPQKVQRGEKQVTICKGPLKPVPNFYDRDDFINKLAGQISPLPQGIRMWGVTVNGGYVYLFEVPESQNKPHQYDGRYYVRMDTRTDAAPHYLVYALCRQVRNPELTIKIKAGTGSCSPANEYITIPIHVEIQNIVELANDYDIYLRVNTPNGSVKRQGLLDGYSTMIFDVSKILSCGLPEEYTFYLDIKKQVYPEGQPFMTIWFGGKNSSVKKVIYKIVFGDQSSTYSGSKINFEVNLETTDV